MRSKLIMHNTQADSVLSEALSYLQSWVIIKLLAN